MRLLLAEDDVLLGDGLCNGLGQLGFQVEWARDGIAAERALLSRPFEAAVLDLGLGQKDGLDVLKTARHAGVATPVLVLTARDTVPDRIRGLDSGADDYLVKPLDLNELAARLRALVRRAQGHQQGAIGVQDLVLDPAARVVRRAGSVISLSTKEFDLLHAFMLSEGRVLTREQLERQLYAWGKEVESNAIEVHIHNLRRKLGSKWILTVRGVGYMLRVPNT